MYSTTKSYSRNESLMNTEVKRKMKTDENVLLDWRPTMFWGRQGLASVGMSVGFMVQWRVVLGDVVDPVDPPRAPIKTELILGSAAGKPIKPYVHRFGMKRHNCVITEAGGGGVVSLKGKS